MNSTWWARRFDFDPEVAVRLVWRGPHSDKHPNPRPLSERGGRRRVPVSLPPRQYLAYLDALEVAAGIPDSPTCSNLA